jgi:hypothetical protein
LHGLHHIGQFEQKLPGDLGIHRGQYAASAGFLSRKSGCVRW